MFYGEIGLLCSRSRSQQNFKMSMNVCPDDIFWIAEPFTTKLGMVMHHYEPDCLSKRLVCCLQGQGHNNIIKIWLFNILSELLILLQAKLGLMVHHHKVDCLWKDWIALLWSRSRSQKRFRIPVNVHLEWYLLSCWTFCNQTWYGDATSWAKVSCKKIGLLSSSSGSQWGLI